MTNPIRAALLAAVLITLAWTAGAASAADMRPFGRGSWRELLKSNAGKPVIVHFWGLTCAPCLTELPHWADLLRQRPDINVIMVAADPGPANLKGQAATLQSAGLSRIESWTFADPFLERLRFEIDPKWQGEMPRTILVSGEGTFTAMSGVADLRAVRDWFDSQKQGPGR